MEHHLDGVVVCISGDPRFDKDKNQHIRDQFTEENVSRWLKYRGGKLVEEVTKTTTHLICSRAAYNKKGGNPKVKAARKYGCKIVTYEWLTDTFQLLDYHKKKAPPSLYHPGKPRDGDAISDLFKKSKTKPKAVKKKASPAAADTTAVEHDDDAQAADEMAETGMKPLAISEEKDSQNSPEEEDHQKVSKSGEEKDTKVIDDTKGASTPVSKPTGKPKKSAKVQDQEPPVNLSLYEICKDGSGLYQTEVWKPDKHGNARGVRWVLELYESKSEPRTYLFGARRYPKPGSSACIRNFPSKAPGDKKHELKEFKHFFWLHTGVNWRRRDSLPSEGPYYYLSSAPPGKTVGNTSHKNKSDELGEMKERKSSSSVTVPHEHRGVDGETSLKRRSSFSEDRPAKAFKVAKPSVASDSAKVTDGGSKTA